MAGSVKLRVVHVTTLHPVFDIRIFHKECRSLAQAGYDVTLIAPHERNETVDGVRIIGLARINNRLGRMLVSGYKAYRLAASQRAAIYHFHDPELLPWMALLKRRAHVIYDVHEDLAKAVLTKRWLPASLRRIIAGVSRAAERYLSRGMHLVLAEHSYAGSYNWGPTTTVLNMPRLDELGQISEPKYDTPTVGYFGAVNASRGSTTMIRALGKLRAEGLQVALECLGPVSEQHKAELAALAGELGVTAHVRGYTLAQDGWRIMARCHMGLALLHAQPNYVDSYPTKIFEYMALGLPVVSSNFPLYRDLVESERCGICINPTDEHAIAEAIRALLGNPAEAATMGQRGKHKVQRSYSWEREALQLLDLYAKLLSKCAG